MGIELMARAARRSAAMPAPGALCVEQVAIHEPLVLGGPQGMAPRADVQASPLADGSVQCSVHGRSRADAAVPLFDARVGTFTGGAPPTALPDTMDLLMPMNVRAPQVYALYFHGPAWRVVRSARLAGEAMLCELNPYLPALMRDAHDPLVAAPQWVELAMQAAGLLEIALRARMMIPHRIERIAVFSPVEAAPRQQVFAYARFSGAGTDIDLVDAGRRLLLRISGYQTTALPFATDTAAVSALQRALTARSN